MISQEQPASMHMGVKRSHKTCCNLIKLEKLSFKNPSSMNLARSLLEIQEKSLFSLHSEQKPYIFLMVNKSHFSFKSVFLFLC